MSARAESTSPLARLAGALASTPGARKLALAALAELALPNSRDDAWKYGATRLLDRRDLAPLAPKPVDLAALNARPALDAHRIVLVDGRLRPDLGSLDAPGVTLTDDLPSDLSTDPAFFGDPQSVDDRLRFLNGALCPSRVTLAIAADTCIERPIEIVLIATGNTAYPRLVVELGQHASVSLIEWHLGVGSTESLMIAHEDIHLAAGATLHHATLEQSGSRALAFGDIRARLAADSHYRHQWVALGGQHNRLDLQVSLEGAGAHATLTGLFMADTGSDHHLRTRIEHRAAHTGSDQRYRGVAGGRGRGSYDGKIVVHPGAQKTSSRQSSRNLLLGREAEIDTRPQLEINADDVKCSHGATTGTLDPQMEFYLLSRGLDPNAARALLTYAFVGDILKDLKPAALRQAIETQVLTRLPDAALLREFVA